MAVQKTHITIAEFARFLDLPENVNRRFELINGEISEKMPTEEHGLFASRIHGEIYIFLKGHPIGRVTIEPRHQMPGDDENSRLPDLAFTSRERMLPLVRDGAVPQMPDFAIEIKSPTDKLKAIREKAAYYLANGCRMVWIVLPEKRLVEVYTLDKHEIYTMEDVIDGGDVLPGFSLSVAFLFAPEG